MRAAVQAVVEELYPVGQARTVYAAGVPVAVCLTPVAATNLAALAAHVMYEHQQALAAATTAQAPCRFLVGLSGPAGAGKSTLGGLLVAVLNAVHPRERPASEEEVGPNSDASSPTTAAATGGDFSCLLGLDGYHKMNDALDAAGTRGVKGRPETLDIEAFVADVRRLKYHAAADGPIGLPLYDRPTHNPKLNALWIPCPPAFPVIVIEGILLYTEGNGFEPLYTATSAAAEWEEGEKGRENGDRSPQVAPLLDLRLYLDLPEPVARQRVNGRKVAGGRPHTEVEAHYLLVDQHNHLDMDRGVRHAQRLLVSDPQDNMSYALQ